MAKGFLNVSGIDARHYNELSGTSLWDPEADWVHGSSDGPGLLYLPQKLWILGLGHLGQAYLWSLGSMPYAEPRKTQLMLQDFDRAVEANLGTGMLCTEQSIGILKTRVCSDWLERRGLQTRMVERRFDASVVPHENDPLVALCAFDSAASRSILEKPGFDLVVEAGIGGDLGNFDHVFLHTFPGAAKEPGDIWPAQSNIVVDPELVAAFHPDERCGVVAETLARKAISSAFVGAIAGSLVVAEVLRGLHGGKRSEFLRFQVRRDSRPTVVYLREQYQLRFARSGYILANTKALNAGPPVVNGIAASEFSKLARYWSADHAQER